MKKKDAVKVLAACKDFEDERGLYQALIEKAGHLFLFFPRFHCEFSAIEYYFSLAKQNARKNCDYTWAGLKKAIPLALDAIPLAHIRNCFVHCQENIKVYTEVKEDASYEEIEAKMKLYKSHRRVYVSGNLKQKLTASPDACSCVQCQTSQAVMSMSDTDTEKSEKHRQEGQREEREERKE